MALVLACDLGGTSLRAGLVDADGTIRHMASLPGPTVIDRLGGSEADVADWWRNLVSAVEILAEAAGPAFDDIAAIAISGVTRTQIFLGRDSRVLRPAITWGDSRGNALMDEMRRTLPATHPEMAQFNAFHPVSRLYWLHRHEPLILPATAAVLEPKDYFNYRLTGRLATDRISSARLLAAAEPSGGAGSLLDALGIDASIVPEALNPTAIVGNVLPGLEGPLARLSGRPVVAMAHDTWASVLGLGALRNGYAYNLSGTTEVLGVLSARRASAEGLLSVDWGEAVHQLGGPSQNGADTVIWALELLSRHAVDPASVGRELQAILAERRYPQPIVFLPYLQGERTPYWNAALRGAFIGLNRRHRAVDCVWAVLEGVAFLNRIVLERAEAANGRKVGEIRFGGGGSANETWCRIKADICERPVVVTRSAEPGLVGGAIAGFHALGDVPSIEAGQDRMVAIARRYEPDRERRDDYRRLYDLYRRAETALAPISADLSRWTRDRIDGPARPGTRPTQTTRTQEQTT